MPAERALTIHPIAKPDFPKIREIGTPRLNGDMALIECIIPQTENFKPFGAIKTMMDQKQDIAMTFLDEQDRDTKHEFTLVEASQEDNADYPLPVIKATLEVPIEKLSFFFPKTKNSPISIFESKLISSLN